MSGSKCSSVQKRKASETMRFEAREEQYQFRFSMENFQLSDKHAWKSHSNSDKTKEFLSPPFISGSGAESVEWCVKVSIVQRGLDSSITTFQRAVGSSITFQREESKKVCCDLQETANKTDTTYTTKTVAFHFVKSTGDLEPLSTDGYDYDTLLRSGKTLLPNDTLTVQCDLSLSYVSLKRRRTSAGPTNDDSLRKLQSDLRELYQSETNSDVVLRCGDQDFRVHKSVLSARSAVFAKMFEHDTKERRENVVEIADASPEAIGAMLKYVYCGEMDVLTTKVYGQVYSVADKYDLQELKAECSECMVCNLEVDNVCSLAIVAHLCNDEVLLVAAKQFLRANTLKVMTTRTWMNLLSKYQELAEKLVKE